MAGVLNIIYFIGYCLPSGDNTMSSRQHESIIDQRSPTEWTGTSSENHGDLPSPTADGRFGAIDNAIRRVPGYTTC